MLVKKHKNLSVYMYVYLHENEDPQFSWKRNYIVHFLHLINYIWRNYKLKKITKEISTTNIHTVANTAGA